MRAGFCVWVESSVSTPSWNHLTLIHILMGALELRQEALRLETCTANTATNHSDPLPCLTFEGEKSICVFFCFLPEIEYSWIFNGQRSFLQQDARRFISQRTGDLYIAKVEASDVGNYTCAVRNMMTNATVFSSPAPVVVRRDGKRASPVPPLLWRRRALH